MKTDNTVLSFQHPDIVDDPLTSVLRDGARRLLAQAIEAEAGAFLAMMRDERLPDGRARLVRHGHGPQRTIQTGIGPVAVRRVKLRDRGAAEAGAEGITFASAILPKWARRTRSLDALLPVLYLRGISTGDFQEALAALLGDDAPDGVYLQARMDDSAACMLVVIGATPEGRKDLIGFQVGVRESAQSWRELLVDLKARGLVIAPEIAVGDGALGFWKAIDEIFPATRHQRCWVHKVANVLNKVPKSVQPNMKADLCEVRNAPDRATADAAMTVFVEKYSAKYPKAVACLSRDREQLLAFFDFPAEHWDHLRTTNPIESVFATVRHRTVRTKGALSQKTARLMVFKLIIAASKTWRRLKGENQLPKVIQGVKFTNGVAVTATPNKDAA